ncbi:MAG: hypothetical protein DPW11_02440 [bacterium]|nr:hypothetical protein [Candidatus Microgenomates bacterium CPR3]MCQ3944610.1 hypothetical protein [bacterium]RIK52218.1 MAG: hypothetical protein DCC61_00315 [Candidatus Microgenomates bacterium]
MRVVKIISVLLSTFYFLLSIPLPVRADDTEATEPFAPFSVEGNPDKEYHFEQFFPLYKYIRPPFLKIYENRDRSREYNNYMLCDGGDRRDYVCAVDNQSGEEVDPCEGGEVDICIRDTDDVVYTAESGPNSSCSAKPDPELSGTTKGKCSYKQRPSISRTIKGTDFSAEKPIYPKYQSEDLAYANIGTSNAISWGSQYLTSEFCNVALRKIVVVKRAKQTKATLNQTGEWPLGWVDWGYQVGIDHDLNPDTPTQGTKTLGEIEQELPDNISVGAIGLIEMLDDMYMNPGNYDLLKGLGETQVAICKEVSKEATKITPDQWYIDLMSAPLYPPSFRQGFVGPSICVWNVCCPKNPDKCWVPDFMIVGIRRGLYYDTSISQAFNGAIDELFMTYPLDQAMKIFRNLAAVNPLIRFASVASINGVPSFIHQKLYEEQKGGCFDYIPWSNWKYFRQWIDYLDPDEKLGPQKNCPNYKLQPTLTKDKGASYPELSLSWLLQLAFIGWGEGNKIDEVEQVKYHLITIPEAMGQSIKEIRQGFYDSRDTLTDLEAVKDFNDDLSITVDDEADLLYGRSGSAPSNTRRNWGFLTCADPMFSSQLDTTVEEYALSMRVGCDEAGQNSLDPNAVCDGKLFGELIAGSEYESPSAKGQSYFDTYIKNNLTEELMATYASAEKETGVPCEILAGIHFVEGANNPDASLVSGRKLGTPEPDAGGKVFKTLLDTATYAGEHLKGKVGGNIGSAEDAITALSRYNGGGNSNCQVGYPYPIPYNGCPRIFEGEDDPYPTSYINSKHDNMYLLYCADRTACAPQPFQRPGSFAVALAVYNSITKSGYTPTDLPDTPSAATDPQTTTTSEQSSSGRQAGFFPTTCGEGSLATALGCLPYEYRAFITTLLRFLVGISGGISLIVMLTGVIRLITSSGDSKQVQSGRELFTAGIAGLLLVIFSVSLLRLFAADILKLPGF